MPEVLDSSQKNSMNKLHLLHFLVQRSLLLASQEAIFNRPKYFFTLTRALVWSSVEWWGAGGCSLHGQNESGLLLDGWIGCNLKPFRGHIFMTNSVTPHTLHPQKWTIDLLFINKRISMHMTNFKTPHPFSM